MTDVYFTVDIDGWTGRMQLSIGDEHGGFRIEGPKYNGSSKRQMKAVVDKRAAEEIRRYLDLAFPVIAAQATTTERERLEQARQALLADGYFTDAEVGPDIAPRIIERLSAVRAEAVAAERGRIIALASQLRAQFPADHPKGAMASFADYLRVTSGGDL